SPAPPRTAAGRSGGRGPRSRWRARASVWLDPSGAGPVPGSTAPGVSPGNYDMRPIAPRDGSEPLGLTGFLTNCVRVMTPRGAPCPVLMPCRGPQARFQALGARRDWHGPGKALCALSHANPVKFLIALTGLLLSAGI